MQFKALLGEISSEQLGRQLAFETKSRPYKGHSDTNYQRKVSWIIAIINFSLSHYVLLQFSMQSLIPILQLI